MRFVCCVQRCNGYNYCYNPPGAQLKDYHQGLVHYQLPASGLTWASIFSRMEEAKNTYHIEDYSVGQTSLEQVNACRMLKFEKIQLNLHVLLLVYFSFHRRFFRCF